YSCDTNVTPTGQGTNLFRGLCSGSNDLSGQGTLIMLKFTVNPNATESNQNYPLNFRDYTDGLGLHPGFRYGNGAVQVMRINGQFKVMSPSAAPAKISGQVVTGDGQPVSGTTITVTSGAKIVRDHHRQPLLLQSRESGARRVLHGYA